ncbi:MAG: hypothetical protein K6E51_11055, partial [Treponema sp.]|nr:hypothetical protein [Treponema sp.]
KSFTRPSCIYQYNAYRKEVEMQKTLISKGSVFTFNSGKELTADEKEKVLSAIKKGIGDAKGQGFGEIAVFDAGKEFTKEDFNDKQFENSESKTSDGKKQDLSEEEKVWLEWVKPVFLSKDVKEKVMKAVSEFEKLCKAIKIFQTFDDETIFWPGNAQWGRILEATRLCKTKTELHSKLFDGNSPIIKPIIYSQTKKNSDKKEEKNPDKEWNYEASPKGETLREWLEAFIADKNSEDKDLKMALQELVKRCKDKIADTNWLSGDAK